jgi:hypothetical protein
MAEADQLALDAPVPPARIVAGHLQHQGSDRRRDRWSARPSARVGPAVGNELGMPTQQGSGDTSRIRRSGAGSSLLSALSTARSRQVNAGRALVRRSTATS